MDEMRRIISGIQDIKDLDGGNRDRIDREYGVKYVKITVPWNKEKRTVYKRCRHVLVLIFQFERLLFLSSTGVKMNIYDRL